MKDLKTAIVRETRAGLLRALREDPRIRTFTEHEKALWEGGYAEALLDVREKRIQNTEILGRPNENAPEG